MLDWTRCRTLQQRRRERKRSPTIREDDATLNETTSVTPLRLNRHVKQPFQNQSHVNFHSNMTLPGDMSDPCRLLLFYVILWSWNLKNRTFSRLLSGGGLLLDWGQQASSGHVLWNTVGTFGERRCGALGARSSKPCLCCSWERIRGGWGIPTASSTGK